MATNTEHPLASLCQEWLRKIEIAKKVKHEAFGQYAAEAAKFYDSTHDWMWREESTAASTGGFLDKSAQGHLPTFRMQVNKAFEAVALFGPALMHKYPQVMVTPVNPPILGPEIMGMMPDSPDYQQYVMFKQQSAGARDSVAKIKEHYLNWLQIESNKKSHARRAITEAIVKGLGLLWVEIYNPPGSQIRYPSSRFISCDDIVKDPDAMYNEDVTWMARRCIHPLNRVAAKYGLPEEELRGKYQSFDSQSTPQAKRDRKSNKQEGSQSYDLVEYWEIYSKNGFGHRLKATNKQSAKSQIDLNWLGDYCYLAVASNIPYPLNLPSYTLGTESPEDLFMRCQWPIPFWTDEGLGNGWPCAELHFYDKLNCVWPLSLLKPAIGELRFINWCMSFLADKTAAACETYIGMMKAAGAEIQSQMMKGRAPYTVIEISELFGKRIDEVVSFLQTPNFPIDIWKMVAEVMQMIDKRTGLTELIYGMTGTQMRSATEADIRESHTSIRPDDMAERTEEFYSVASMKECEAAVWALEKQDVMGVLGEDGASVFEEYIQTQDFDSVVRDYNYRLEAGSARKPNKNAKMRSLNEWGALAVPAFQAFAMQGVVGPWNAYMLDVAKTMDLDASGYLLPDFFQQAPEENPGEGEEELARDEERHEQQLRHKEESHRLDMKMKKEKAGANGR